jgi:hypothetical protein
MGLMGEPLDSIVSGLAAVAFVTACLVITFRRPI